MEDACAEYDTRAAAGRNPVMQQWVDGEPLSLSLVCGAQDVELVSINRQLIGLPDAAALRAANSISAAEKYCERSASRPRSTSAWVIAAT